MKILIAVPTFENIYPDTYKSIYQLDIGDHDVIFDFVRGYDCAHARNAIAQEAIDESADYVLMVDNDVVLPPDALMNLLEHNEQVVLGFYAIRNKKQQYDGRASVFKTGEVDFKKAFSAQEMTKYREAGITALPVHGGGMGCALIKTSVFERLEFPWFSWVQYKDKRVLGEDLYFCDKCNNNGITVYVDPRVCCGHMLRYVCWAR